MNSQAINYIIIFSFFTLFIHQKIVLDRSSWAKSFTFIRRMQGISLKFCPWINEIWLKKLVFVCKQNREFGEPLAFVLLLLNYLSKITSWFPKDWILRLFPHFRHYAVLTYISNKRVFILFLTGIIWFGLACKLQTNQL